ncbi:hypothetical protein DPMN_194862 [Dreissena polymorpha]|uniref:Uncharacterized protein n=1 Tax=Dreissena polymorpha TaxID=45954 RepID=A0A9D3Y1X1_DREPO|nr:hypothetical protein DPMN_194862 [Dreissena polymorpha]
METVDSDKGPIRVRLEDMNQKWENLNEGLSERVQCLEELSSRLTEFEDCSVSLQQSLQDLEKRLDSQQAGILGQGPPQQGQDQGHEG